MIRIRAVNFDQFVAAHTVLRAAGVDVMASGGNEASVPDDTDRAVLRAVAATGTAVDADLTEPDQPAEPSPAEPPTPGEPAEDATQPARKPRKTTTRRTTKE